ncbi:unnamed protein product [Meganyctiphanes norvegica]|uniref:beta-N-acetylhexosaminidase n=1 Tax=Meganyctiphanes norvegica TaxID=48144 RepID=A0AAV2PN68_MEGNR
MEDMATVEGFCHRLVHLDLKGAHPKLNYLEQLFPLLSKLGATGLLVEYEDTLPYSGDLAPLACNSAYSLDDINDLQSAAAANGLSFIPLVQTLGHMEFVLKHDKFRSLREVELYPNVICPVKPESFSLIIKIIEQNLHLHPNINFLHIGADEAWHLGVCEKCREQMELNKWSTGDLYLTWLQQIALFIKEKFPQLTLIIWDDMMRTISVEQLKKSGIGELVEVMVWQYNSCNFNLPEGMFDRYSQVFSALWVASAFKGATGSSQVLPSIQDHINNHLLWLQELQQQKPKFKNFRGFAITGWSRYDHYSILCELLPVAVPSLCLCLRVLTQGGFKQEDHVYISNLLGFTKPINICPFPRPQVVEESTRFPGALVYSGVQMWANQRTHYYAIKNSEGMLGWFNEYMRKHHFINPVQVQSFMPTLIELLQSMSELRSQLMRHMSEILHQETIDEWMGSFMDPIMNKIKAIIQDCNKHILIGGRVRDYPLEKLLPDS